MHNWGLTISQLYIRFGDRLTLERVFLDFNLMTKFTLHAPDCTCRVLNNTYMLLSVFRFNVAKKSFQYPFKYFG